MLEKYADATIISGMEVYDKTKKEDKKIDIKKEDINSLLGSNISDTEIIDIFERLAFKVEKDKDILHVLVPTRRMDISIKEDLIEEVGRIYGVDNIQGRLKEMPIKKGTFDSTLREIRNKMINLGLNETLTYSLVEEKEANMFTNKKMEDIKILAPLTEERSYLRQSLITSLYKTYEYNVSRDNKDVCLFEIGKTFFKDKEEYKEENKVACLMSGEYYLGLNYKNVDFYVIKGVCEEILDYLGYNLRYSFIMDKEKMPEEMHPGKSALISVNNDVVGIIGRITPEICKDEVYVMEINLDKLLAKKVGKMKYKELSKFPVVKKDLAVLVKKDIQAQDLIKTIKNNGGKLLLDTKVFDLYDGKGIKEGDKSIAFSLTFGAQDRTLVDEEINSCIDKIIKGLENKHGATLRK